MPRVLMKLDDVWKDTCYHSEVVPTLGLSDDEWREWRVYVVRCRSQIIRGTFCYYVGVARRAADSQRMKAHLDGAVARFTSAHPPICVELVRPAINKASEAYVFYTLMSKQPKRRGRRPSRRLGAN